MSIKTEKNMNRFKRIILLISWGFGLIAIISVGIRSNFPKFWDLAGEILFALVLGFFLGTHTVLYLYRKYGGTP